MGVQKINNIHDMKAHQIMSVNFSTIIFLTTFTLRAEIYTFIKVYHIRMCTWHINLFRVGNSYSLSRWWSSRLVTNRSCLIQLIVAVLFKTNASQVKTLSTARYIILYTSLTENHRVRERDVSNYWPFCNIFITARYGLVGNCLF